MKTTVCYIILLLFCVIYNPCTANTVGSDSIRVLVHKKERAKAYMRWEVKSISQFIDRFNYEKFIDDEPFTDSIKNVYSRQHYLLTLFNEEDERLLSKKQKVEYYAKIQNLIDAICSNSTKIAKEASQKASIVLNGTYQNKPISIALQLQKQVDIQDHSVAWFITKVEVPTEFLTKKTFSPAIPLDTFQTSHRGLYPNAADVSFVPLLQHINSEKSIHSLLLPPLTFTPELRWMEHTLKEGALLGNVIGEVKIHLKVNDYYTIELQNFSREKENSGWLITDILTHY